METISKLYELGNGVLLKAKIADGIAIIISNVATEWRKQYFMAKKAGKDVAWDYRKNAMIEKYPGKSAQEIEGLLDQDYKTAKKQQKIASEWAKTQKLK